MCRVLETINIKVRYVIYFEDYIQVDTKSNVGCLPPKMPLMEKQGLVRGKLVYSSASSLRRQ